MAVIDERVSRRRLLKRAGIGAAVLGGGAMLTATSASAQFHGDTLCVELGGCGECEFQAACGSNCGCVIGVDACCFCHQGISCAEATACGDNSDCAPGWVCAYTCCGGTICVPPCGFNVTALAVGGPMTTSGGGGGEAAPEPEAPSDGHGGHGHV